MSAVGRGRWGRECVLWESTASGAKASKLKLRASKWRAPVAQKDCKVPNTHQIPTCDVTTQMHPSSKHIKLDIYDQ